MTDKEFVIFVGRDTEIDVRKFYANKGVAALPDTPTMTGAEIKSLLPGCNPFNGLFDESNNKYIGDLETVHLSNGMKFTLVPAATY